MSGHKLPALSTALGLFPSVIKSGEAWSSSGTGSCEEVLRAAKAELTFLTAHDVPLPAKPGGDDQEIIGAALRHAVNFHSIDARLDLSDNAIVDLLMPEVMRHLRGETDVQVFEAMTPQERAEAFSPERLGN